MYNEEFNRLDGQHTYDMTTEEEYLELKWKYGMQEISSMCVLKVKCNKEGIPVRANNRIVVLGSLERYIWEKKDLYVPVIS